MSYPDVCSGCIPAESLVLNPSETAARLSAGRDFRHERVDECLKKLMGVMECRYAYARTGLSVGDGACDFGFMRVYSRDLSRNLKGCTEAFVFAVTLGQGVDRLLLRLAATSAADRFIADGLASSAAEALCCSVSDMLGSQAVCRPRFSPGYGDFPLEFQPEVLSRLNAGTALGITLTEALLMVPSKSITAVMGIVS